MLLAMDGLSTLRDEAAELLYPSRPYSRTEALERPGPVPASPGVYAWYFADAPPNVPTDTCHVTEWGSLLYLGISPKALPVNGGAPSQQNLRKRVKYHFRGNAAGSTFGSPLDRSLQSNSGSSFVVSVAAVDSPSAPEKASFQSGWSSTRGCVGRSTPNRGYWKATSSEASPFH